MNRLFYYSYQSKTYNGHAWLFAIDFIAKPHVVYCVGNVEGAFFSKDLNQQELLSHFNGNDWFKSYSFDLDTWEHPVLFLKITKDNFDIMHSEGILLEAEEQENIVEFLKTITGPTQTDNNSDPSTQPQETTLTQTSGYSGHVPSLVDLLTRVMALLSIGPADNIDLLAVMMALLSAIPSDPSISPALCLTTESVHIKLGEGRNYLVSTPIGRDNRIIRVIQAYLIELFLSNTTLNVQEAWQILEKFSSTGAIILSHEFDILNECLRSSPVDTQYTKLYMDAMVAGKKILPQDSIWTSVGMWKARIESLQEDGRRAVESVAHQSFT